LSFNPERFIQKKVAWLKAEVGSEKAIAATSGGVDSTVTAVLGHRALGKALKVVFLDDGLMRQGEPKEVTSMLRAQGLQVALLDVKSEFFQALRGITDPEEKRKAFRERFYQTLGRAIREHGARCLLQGTIAADIVETRGGVKTQHNVLEQIGIVPSERYGFKVVEPLKELFKPQVREVAKALSLASEVHERKPFPGPGLAVRVIGEVTPARVETVRRASRIVEEETRNVESFQAFAVLLADKATGLREGKRTFGDIIAVRIVVSLDAMTASVPRVPWKNLERIQSRITAELPSVVKVLLDLSPKPPSTIEYE